MILYFKRFYVGVDFSDQYTKDFNIDMVGPAVLDFLAVNNNACFCTVLPMEDSEEEREMMASVDDLYNADILKQVSGLILLLWVLYLTVMVLLLFIHCVFGGWGWGVELVLVLNFTFHLKSFSVLMLF